MSTGCEEDGPMSGGDRRKTTLAFRSAVSELFLFQSRDRARMPSFLFGAAPYNQHAQQIARALHEMDALGLYRSLGVDHYRRSCVHRVRATVGEVLPSLDRLLQRRCVDAVPDNLVHGDWMWELLRTLAARLGWSAVADWLWERSEWKLDRDLAHLIQHSRFDAFFGVEHGCLHALGAAAEVGKPSVLTFMSPHHSALSTWVHPEYGRFPELRSPAQQTILDREPRRYRRKDAEARRADFIHTNSEFSKRTLVDAGFDADKIHVSPLGCPKPTTEDPAAHCTPSSDPVRFLYAGNLSVQKGAHYLIDAWSSLDVSSARAELHCYGRFLLPDTYRQRVPPSMKLHGSVPQQDLFDAFKKGSALALPTLLDGFGMVVTEALAHGLPVITTPNAGAADLIEEGRNGFLAPPADPEALADRLDWCCRHPDVLAEMRVAAVETARNWQWSDFRTRLQHQLRDHLPIT